MAHPMPHHVRTPILEAPEVMPAQPEPIIPAVQDGAIQELPAPSFDGTPHLGAGVDWLAWLEKLARLAEGKPEEPVNP
jgi:hypothetical protein